MKIFSRHLLRFWFGLVVGLLALVSASQSARAQTQADSTTTHSEEVMALPAPASAGTSLIQVQEQHLWKLGLNNLLLLPANWSREVGAVPSTVRYGRYGLHLAYERKLRTPWSVLAEISPYWLSYKPVNTAGDEQALCARAQVAGRYYYNLGRRLRLGKSAGNFAGNYFSVALGGGFGRHAHETAFLFYERSGPFARFDGALLYGLQRRLGGYGFFDFNVGIPFSLSSGATTSIYYPNTSGPALALNLRLGLCLGR
jgi:hypothetical protein